MRYKPIDLSDFTPVEASVFGGYSSNAYNLAVNRHTPARSGASSIQGRAPSLRSAAG